MGNLIEQNVVLTWEGIFSDEVVSLTPDEVKVLFNRGLTTNVACNAKRKLYEVNYPTDIRRYNNAIVCGILAPSTQMNLRKEILSYAKKMGYVTEEMTPVQMHSGTKELLVNEDSYSIFFKWHSSTLQKINSELLNTFTKDFFMCHPVEVKSDGVLMTNLPEKEVFSKENIDMFREYDIQLTYLDSTFDKKLLLRALMQRAFIDDIPFNKLRKGQFINLGKILIPEDRQEHIVFNEFGICKLNCGTVQHDLKRDFYIYQIEVPYTEYIRELMLDTEKLLQAKYQTCERKVSVDFYKYSQCMFIGCNLAEINTDVEREIICLDYAIKLLQDEKHFNDAQLYHSIISLLENDSSGIFSREYFSFLQTFNNVLPEKCVGYLNARL
jgi:hypothetical protein